jgi:hypothetical protein
MSYRGSENNVSFCYAIAPLAGSNCGARVFAAHSDTTYELELTDCEIRFKNQYSLGIKYPHPFFMQVLGNVCLIISSSDRSLGLRSLQLTAINLASGLNHSISGFFDREDVIESAAKERTTPLLKFRMSLIGGVLILRSNFLKKDSCNVIALI